MTSTEYFDELYARDADPWRLATTEYELRKYATTVAAVPGRPRRAFEPGCSVGVLTELLAGRCDELLAQDLSAAAVRTARARVAAHPHVRVEVGRVPADWPEGTLDLVVLSELLYYLSPEDRSRTVDLAYDGLEPDGHLLAVHWRHPFSEAPSDGEAVHRDLRADPRWRVVDTHADPDFLLDLLRPRTGADA